MGAQLSKQQIDRFRDIYRQKYGKDISDEDVLIHGTKLVLLVEDVLDTQRCSSEKRA